MSVDVRVATAADRERWDSLVERSPQGTLCHELAVLELQAEYADATLQPLVGFKGQEPVGIFPVFETSRALVSLGFSPPPDLRVPYLGPAFLNMGKLKQRKRERRRQRFLEGCLDWLHATVGPKYVHVRTPPTVTDIRAFTWNGFDATPQYTYVVDLTPGREALLDRFSSDARRNVTNADPDAYEVGVGGPEAIRAILAQVRARYDSQGVDFAVPDDFVVALAEHASTGDLRPYTLTVDGEFVGGILALEFGSRVARWLGGVRVDTDVDLPTNDLLDWAVMTDAIDRGLTSYDLVGADTPRINDYKAKFAPELRTYYSLEYGRWGMDHVAAVYGSLK